jgi:hypothetical protein
MTQNLITRAQWGARYSDGFGDRPMPVSEWWLHHSVTIAPDLLPPFDDDDRAVRVLEEIGQSRFGGGISYNFPVTPIGRIYQGVSLHRRGAHTYGHNTVGAAFVLVGNYQDQPPTTMMELAVAQRMVIEHRAKRATRHTLNGGHRDASGNYTECPGNAAEARVPAINALANKLWDEGYPNYTPPPAPPSQDLPASWFLTEDGLNGFRTRTAVQRMLGLYPDGSWGPATRRRIQTWVGVTPDGSFGPVTRRAVQRKVGVPVTGVWAWDQSSKPDPTTKGLQAYYNRAVRNRRKPY